MPASSDALTANEDGKPPKTSTASSKRKTFVQAKVGHGYRHYCKMVLELTIVKVMSGFCLAFALFGGYLWVLFDVPDEGWNEFLDAIMVMITFFFVFEVVMLALGQQGYLQWDNFFLWADLLGTISMLFEISFLLGTNGKVQKSDRNAVETLIFRIARVSKLAARAGRIARITKVFVYLFKAEEARAEFDVLEVKRKTASVLSKKIMLVLSTKVAILTMILVLGVPLFQWGLYPEKDYSMSTWALTMETSYKRAYDAATASTTNSSNEFQVTTQQMKDWFEEEALCYRPWDGRGWGSSAIAGYDIPGQAVVSGEVPLRKGNQMFWQVPKCQVSRKGCTCMKDCDEESELAELWIDFTDCNRYAAGMEALSLCFIISVMVLASFGLSSVVDKLALKPLEVMLGSVRDHASKFLDVFEQVAQDDEDEDVVAAKDEAELLEIVFAKLAKLASLTMDKAPMSQKDLDNLDDDQKGVVVQIMCVDQTEKLAGTMERSATIREAQKVANLQEVAGLRQNVIESWELDFLTLEPEARAEVVLHLFFDSRLASITGRKYGEPETFARFYGEAMGAYTEQPYHNAIHACDVLHTVYRLLCLTKADKWTMPVEIYALMVAALGHDLGHQGFTNPYLVETQHEWAVMYNDASPLENMHCSSLFLIASKEGCKVFEKLKAEKDAFKVARKTVVKTILHTDNAHHFDMVKDIKARYEVNSEVFEKQAAEGDKKLLPDYERLLQEEAMLWLQLFLHYADVSNPLKPFQICKAWAWRVLDEFFAQGDEEKRNGLPVGMLNDRDKINRPGSQHGFINFLVAPLVFATVNIFSMLHPMSKQMGDNLEEWRNLWIEEVNPEDEAIMKKDADIERIKDQAKNMAKRCEVSKPAASQAGARKRFSMRQNRDSE